MEKHSTEFVGLDVHKESTAIGRGQRRPHGGSVRRGQWGRPWRSCSNR